MRKLLKIKERKRRKKRKKIIRERKRRRVEMMKRKNKFIRLDQLRLFRSSMSFTKITMMFGQIEMKVKIINNIMMFQWQRKK
jgi:hypothetical protein